MLKRFFCSAVVIVTSIVYLPLEASSAAQSDLPGNNAKALERCIVAGTVLPMLGEKGDSPLIKVTLEGHDAALFVSPEISRLIVRNVSDDFWFPDLGMVQLRSQDANLITASWSRVLDMRLGSFTAGPLDAVLVNSDFPKDVLGVPIVGMLGRSILIGGLVEMIDMPHRSVAFLRWDYAHCGEVSNLLGAGAVELSLTGDNSSAARINDKDEVVHFNPDQVYSTFPLSDASSLGISGREARQYPKINIHFSGSNVGYLTNPESVSLNHLSVGSFRFVLEENVSRIVLGSEFFENRTILFDFFHHRLAFINVSPTINASALNHGGKHLHFDMTYTPSTNIVGETAPQK